MAKKKKGGLFSLSNLLYLVALVASVVAIGLIVAPALEIEGKLATFGLSDSTSYSGMKVVFGAKTEKYEYMLFSFMNLLPYILVLVAAIVLVLKVLGKLNSGIGNIIAVVALVAAGVLFLLVPNFTVLAESFAAAIDLANAFKEVVTLKVGIGAIMAAVCSFVAGVCTLVPMFVKK